MKIRESLLRTLSGNDETYQRLFNNSNPSWMNLRKKPFQIHTFLWYSVVSGLYLFGLVKCLDHVTLVESSIDQEEYTMKAQYEKLLVNHQFGSREDMDQYIKLHSKQYGPEWNATKSSMYKTNRIQMVNNVEGLEEIRKELVALRTNKNQDSS